MKIQSFTSYYNTKIAVTGRQSQGDNIRIRSKIISNITSGVIRSEPFLVYQEIFCPRMLYQDRTTYDAE